MFEGFFKFYFLLTNFYNTPYFLSSGILFRLKMLIYLFFLIDVTEGKAQM